MGDHHSGTYRSEQDWLDENVPTTLNPGEVDHNGICMHGRLDCRHCSPFTCISCHMACSRKDNLGQPVCEVCDWLGEHII